MDRDLILIAGGSGAGKTTMAEVIEEEFADREVTMLSTDRFYRNFEDPVEANYDHPNSINWELMNSCLANLLNSEEAEVPKYDFTDHERKGYENIEAGKLIVLEGIFALVNDDVNDKASLRIYVDADGDLRFIRRLERDLEERGRSKQSVIDQWLNQVRPMHREFIEPSRRNAHVIIPEDPDGNMREAARKLLVSRVNDLIS